MSESILMDVHGFISQAQTTARLKKGLSKLSR